MTKNKTIGAIRIKAERDLAISDGALRLLFRICSNIYTNPNAKLDVSFPVPWSKVAMWCGISDRDTCYNRLKDLVEHKYLKCDGVRGCPPIGYFFLNLNCMENPAINGRQNPANVCRENPANVTRQNPAIMGRENPAHHISNSFQEEKIKGKREEIKTSLPLTGTNGDGKSSLPLTGTKGIEQMDDAKRRSHVHALRRLRREIESDGGKTKTKTKAKTLLMK